MRVLVLGIFTASLLALSNLALACGTSATCDASDESGYYSCTLDYCATENLSYSYDWEGIDWEFGLGDGTLSGDYEAEVYIQPGSPECIYVQLTATSDTVASYSDDDVNTGDVTIVDSGTTTQWCQYLGVEINCPIENIGSLNFSQDVAGVNYDFDNTFSIKGIIDFTSDVPVTVALDWDIDTSVSTCGLTASAGGSIEFPAGGFDDFMTANIASTFSEVAGCEAPDS